MYKLYIDECPLLTCNVLNEIAQIALNLTWLDIIGCNLILQTTINEFMLTQGKYFSDFKYGPSVIRVVGEANE